MQTTGILDFILGDPLILIAIFWIVGIIIAVVLLKRSKGSKEPKDLTKPQKPKRSKIKVKGHLMKQIQKMEGQAEKDKELTVPPVRSRQEIITEIFESKTSAIGLEASTAGGYVPVSYTPLARFLKDRNVAEDTVSAIIAGIMEEDNAESVKAIIEAAADSPEVDLIGNELDKAKELAVQEWRNVKTRPEV
ncbi:MAG: hypothetical protein ACTSWA_01460 [Candidatus Thorarchaeota archaeon]